MSVSSTQSRFRGKGNSEEFHGFVLYVWYPEGPGKEITLAFQRYVISEAKGSQAGSLKKKN